MLSPQLPSAAPTSSDDPTRVALAEMLVESTGTSILDSGSAYGRHWQRNRTIRDFEFVAPTRCEFVLPIAADESVEPTDGWWVDCSLHIYDWLAERLTYLPGLDADFERFAEWLDARNHDSSWLGYASRWTESALVSEFLTDAAASSSISDAGQRYLRCLADDRVTGLYGDGDPFVVNTYNGPDLLSQTLQYVFLEAAGTQMVLLSIHGGCDVRGGYGRPRFFELNSECAIFDNARAFLTSADGLGSTCWYTDDAGYTWHSDAPGLAALGEYAASTNPDERGQEIIYVDDDGRGHCPVTGETLVFSG